MARPTPPLSIAARPHPDVVKRHQRLSETLMRELFQTERSAELHCIREAARLSGPPATALRACAIHAVRVNRELPQIARQCRLPASVGGSVVGRVFSALRERIFDRAIEEERSYRGTLLGLRHGVDVVRMLQHVADASGRLELAGFCTSWLAEREPLVGDVARAMSWFALHPEVAVARPPAARQLTHAT